MATTQVQQGAMRILMIVIPQNCLEQTCGIRGPGFGESCSGESCPPAVVLVPHGPRKCIDLTMNDLPKYGHVHGHDGLLNQVYCTLKVAKERERMHKQNQLIYNSQPRLSPLHMMDDMTQAFKLQHGVIGVWRLAAAPQRRG